MSGGTPEHPPLARKNFFGGARVVQRPPRGQPQLSKMGVPGPAPAANHRRRCPGTGFVEWDDLPCQVCPPIGLTCRVTSGLANASPVVSWRRPSVRATCQVCPSTRLHLGHRLPKFFFFFFPPPYIPAMWCYPHRKVCQNFISLTFFSIFCIGIDTKT